MSDKTMGINAIIAAGIRRRIASGELVPITAKPERAKELAKLIGKPLTYEDMPLGFNPHSGAEYDGMDGYGEDDDE